MNRFITLILVILSIFMAHGAADEVADWRLELLNEIGVSAETDALLNFKRERNFDDHDLDMMIKQLGS